MRKIQMIIGALCVIALLVVGACAPEAETVTTTVTLPATTVTLPATTVTLPATTVTLPATTVAPPTTTPPTTTPPTTTPPTTTPPTTTPPTTQPQVITSPDGKLQILNHEMEISPGLMPATEVQGVVKNISSSTVSAEIKVEFYDAAGALLVSEVQIIEDLAPGGSRRFEIFTYDPKYMDVKSYKISVRTVS